MAMLPFAFSVHNFISSIGADAGFAAIIGLAVLILLYFAHARETANLREEAALLTQRLQQAEARVVQLSRAQPAPAAPAATQPAAPALLTPFAPAGVGAPAIASATRMIPVAPPPVQQVPAEAEPEPVAAPVAAMAMAGVAASSASSASSASPVQAPEGPAPAGTATPASGVPAPATSAGGNGAGRPPVAPPPRSAEPAWPGEIGASRGTPSAARPRPPLGPLPPLKPERERSRLGRGVVVALAALAAVAVAVVVFAVTSVGPNNPTPASQTTNVPTPGHPGTAAAGFKPSSVTVAVLNGTSTNQLAHRIGLKLAAFGYKEGTIATAASQTETTTAVAYVGGSAKRTRAIDRTDALHVARALGLRPSAVRPVDQSTLQVACPASAACTANVVVTVGADLANL